MGHLSSPFHSVVRCLPTAYLLTHSKSIYSLYHQLLFKYPKGATLSSPPPKSSLSQATEPGAFGHPSRDGVQFPCLLSELLSSSGPSRGQRRARVESPVANLDSYSLSARPEQPFALPLKFTSHSSLLLNNQLKSPRSFSQTPASAHTSLPCRLSVHPPL